MRRISVEALREVEQTYREYEQEVESTSMTYASRRTYLLHSRNFVRWLKGEFEPGTTLE